MKEMKLAVIANPEKYEVKEPFRMIMEWSDKNDVPVSFSHQLGGMIGDSPGAVATQFHSEEEAIDQADIIIALGGDGTMLYTAHLVKNVQKPILGINSGRLGFMAYTQQNNLAAALDYLQNGAYRLEKRFLLQAEDQNGNTYHALNEFLFSKTDSTSMITVDAEYDDMFINKYWSDGLIVASPTGSTAYNLSSDGPIVMPDSNVMVLTPINPHTLTTRPLVLPSDKPLKITVEKQPHEVLFSYDGIICDVQGYPLKVNIQRSEFSVDLIELPDQSYFNTLRLKLMWGLDYRQRR